MVSDVYGYGGEAQLHVRGEEGYYAEYEGGQEIEGQRQVQGRISSKIDR